MASTAPPLGPAGEVLLLRRVTRRDRRPSILLGTLAARQQQSKQEEECEGRKLGYLPLCLLKGSRLYLYQGLHMFLKERQKERGAE